ncbi:MAG: hypothetical protein GY814_12990 [Gammaproteobacteria bacterium]|nr:hypothetical protein [Gammaproteobacteria bacterium]
MNAGTFTSVFSFSLTAEGGFAVYRLWRDNESQTPTICIDSEGGHFFSERRWEESAIFAAVADDYAPLTFSAFFPEPHYQGMIACYAASRFFPALPDPDQPLTIADREAFVQATMDTLMAKGFYVDPALTAAWWANPS